jgi:hypothetical protein
MRSLVEKFPTASRRHTQHAESGEQWHHTEKGESSSAVRRWGAGSSKTGQRATENGDLSHTPKLDGTSSSPDPHPLCPFKFCGSAPPAVGKRER